MREPMYAAPPQRALLIEFNLHCDFYRRGVKLWLCCKNKLGHKNTERYFSSGGNLEEALHESNLSADVAFPDSLDLSLSDYVHDLIPADGSPRRLETEEAESGIDPALYESAPLLDDVI
jgi:hypothetical protein